MNKKFIPVYDLGKPTEIVKMTKWTFPSLMVNDKYYMLDRSQTVSTAYYVKFTKENDEELSQQEKDYNWRIHELMKIHDSDNESLKYELHRMTIKFEACSNILERLRGSVWKYILFRLKI